MKEAVFITSTAYGKAVKGLNEASVSAERTASGRLFHACKVDGRKDSAYARSVSCQHYAAYRKIHHQHGMGEYLIDKEVIDHDSF